MGACWACWLAGGSKAGCFAARLQAKAPQCPQGAMDIKGRLAAFHWGRDHGFATAIPVEDSRSLLHSFLHAHFGPGHLAAKHPAASHQMKGGPVRHLGLGRLEHPWVEDTLYRSHHNDHIRPRQRHQNTSMCPRLLMRSRAI